MAIVPNLIHRTLSGTILSYCATRQIPVTSADEAIGGVSSGCRLIAEADVISDPSLLHDGFTQRDRIALETY